MLNWRSWAALLATMAVVIQSLSAPAFSKDVGNIGVWRLFELSESGPKLCGASVTYKRGIDLYLKWEEGSGQVYFQLFNRNWKSVRNGRRYSLDITFDGASVPHFEDLQAVGIHENTLIGLSVNASRAFLKRFQKSNRVVMRINRKRVLADLRLLDVAEMVDWLSDCAARKFGATPLRPGRRAPADPEGVSPFPEGAADPFMEI